MLLAGTICHTLFFMSSPIWIDWNGRTMQFWFCLSASWKEPYASGSLALTANVTTSVSTSVSTSVQLATVGSLSYMSPSTSQNPSTSSGIWPNAWFPPAPPASPPPTLAYPIPPRMATPPCSPCRVHQLKLPHRALHPFLRPNFAMLALHTCTTSPGGHTTTDDNRAYGFDLNPHWQEDKDHYDNQKINGLTFPGAFVNLLSRISWTLKGVISVILWNCQWRPCCTNRPTTSGFASWLMDVNFTWSLPGTSQLLCSWLNSWLNSETKASTWTRSLPASV